MNNLSSTPTTLANSTSKRSRGSTQGHKTDRTPVASAASAAMSSSSATSTAVEESSVAEFTEEIDNFLRFSGAEPLKPNSIFILVMGMTGSGKSTFISRCTGKDAKIGHDLQSCTDSLSLFSFEHRWPTPSSPVHNIYLLDSPGFDDTNRSDISTLQLLTHYLSVSYANRIYISGVIYMHRISDNRVSGTTKRNIAMFKKLCGEGCWENVAVVTTMWKDDEQAMNERKEEQLRTTEDFFGDVLAEPTGGKMFRHDVSVGRGAEETRLAKRQALSIIEFLMARAKAGPVVLQIQSEMVDEMLSLDRTEAGKVLVGDLAVVRGEFEVQVQAARREMKEAMERRDGNAVELARETASSLRKKEEEVEKQTDAIRVGLVEMHRLENERLDARMAEMEREWKQELAKREAEVKAFEESLAHLKEEAEKEAKRKDDQAREREVRERKEREDLEFQLRMAKQKEAEGLNSYTMPDSPQKVDVEKLRFELERFKVEADEKRQQEEMLATRRREHEFELERQEVYRMRMQFEQMRAAMQQKEFAVGRVKRGMGQGILDGIGSGVAQGVVSAVVPMVVAGMFCSVM